MTELIVAISGAIVGVGGLIFGIVKWVAARRELKKREEVQTTKDQIWQQINPEIKSLNANIVELSSQMKRLEEKQDDNERCRIRAEIMDVVTEIDNGLELSDAMHEHAEKEYAKYKSLGGNSYIDHQMERVRDYFTKRNKK